MRTHIQLLLAEIGVDIDRCPVCSTANWEFSGDLHDGIQQIGCRTCGQHYTMMFPHDAVATLARQLASAVTHHSLSEARAAYQRLVNAWYTFDTQPSAVRRLVVTREGVTEEYIDDIPL